MEDEAFLRGLAANPDDDTHRLVYADWLDEHADCRGAFLRAAVATRNLPANAPDLRAHLHRLHQLRSTINPGWIRRAYPSLADDDVREVVFRQLIGDGGMGYATFGGRGIDTFVRVENEQDPSPYLFAQLADRCIDVRPASAAELRNGVYRNQRTDCFGSMVSIDELRWVAEDCCEVVGENFMNGMMASGHLYRVGITNGWWAVQEVTLLWIS